MASNTAQNGTILRVKRKCTDDPFEALLIHQKDAKRSKNDDDTLLDRECVFQFAGTIHTDDAAQNVINDIKTNKLLKPAKVSQIKSKARKSTQNHQKQSRFHLVSNLRHENNCKAEESTDTFAIFDVVSESQPVNKQEEVVPTENKEEDIFCNSVKLIREKLHIEDENIDGNNEGYVYDLYYAPQKFDGSEMIDVEFYEDILEHDDSDDGLYDDEDDSNDENNWRNDYPDEDQCNSSAEDENYDTSEDELDHGYRNKRVSFNGYYDNTDTNEYYHTVADSDNSEYD